MLFVLRRYESRIHSRHETGDQSLLAMRVLLYITLKLYLYFSLIIKKYYIVIELQIAKTYHCHWMTRTVSNLRCACSSCRL